MSFTIIDCDQRSPQWFAARAGRLTGSRAADMLATIKSGEAAARRDYRMQLVCERLTGQPQEDGFVNAAMQRGIDLEPRAFAAYEALTGSVVSRTGFLAHTTHMAGCSLDGHVDGFKGIVELKVPKSSTHLRYWRGPGQVPAEYLPQVTHNLWICADAEWCDFLSFDDRFPSELQTFLVRVNRSDVDIDGYEKKALAFLAEVEAEVLAIKTATKGAYRVLRVPGHPLATNPQGDVYHHRLVAYAASGGVCGPCHWCSKPLEWKVAVIDHLNEDKADNHPSNLKG